MQWPPLSFWGISLWLAATATILLITVQLISSYDGPATILVDTKKLKYAASAMGLLFLATVFISIYGIVSSS
jgi:hypothetical protein